jgi:peptidoglycan biosynthesis protein MviN/MurJ (putative lipid II flippase)
MFESILRVENIPGTSVLMLPLAFSIGMIFNSILLWFFFEKSFKGFTSKVWKTAVQSFVASISAGALAYILLALLDDVFDINTLFGIFAQGFISGIVGLSLAVVILILLKNEEVKEVWKTLHHKFWKARAIADGQGEL